MGKLLGRRLSKARPNEGVSQAFLGNKLGVTQTTISNWESGRTSPDETELVKLRRVLGPFDKSPTSKNGDTDTLDGTTAFSVWLTKARERAGMTISELAGQSGVSTVAVYNLESGRSQNPRAETRTRLEKALKAKVPEDVKQEVAEEQSIVGLGQLTDFDPHDDADLPALAGVCVLYDVSDRPIYVGMGKRIGDRIREHSEEFWFKRPIVDHAAYVGIADETLRRQVEQVLIKFLKSNAVINKQSVER